MKRLLSVCLVVISSLTGKSQNLTGKQILDRSISVYRSATSYQDIGRAVGASYKLPQSTPEHTTTRDFQTAYYRPTQLFRFHYKTANSPFLLSDELFIWTDGGKAYQWWNIQKKIIRQESVDTALWAATGISGTASRKIPGLLLNAVTEAGWGIDSMKNVKLLGSGIQNKRACYRLSGSYRKNQVAFLWVDKESFLLLRVDDWIRISDKRIVMSLTYQPLLNKPVPIVRFSSSAKH